MHEPPAARPYHYTFHRGPRVLRYSRRQRGRGGLYALAPPSYWASLSQWGERRTVANPLQPPIVWEGAIVRTYITLTLGILLPTWSI